MTSYFNTSIKFPIILKLLSSYDICKLIIRKYYNKIIIGIVSSPLTLNIKTSSPFNYGLFCEKIFDYIKYCNICKNNYFNINRLDCNYCCFCNNILKYNKYRKYRFGAILLNFPILINNKLLELYLYKNYIKNIKYIVYENSEFNYTNSEFIIKNFLNKISKFILYNNNFITYFNNKKLIYYLNNNLIKNIFILLFPITPTNTRKLSNNKYTINNIYSKLIEINNIINYKYNTNSYNINKLINIFKLYKLINNIISIDKNFLINKTSLLNLKKKNGILKQQLLGCRSDFSSRTVIIPGSDININNIGIPLNIVKYILSGYLIHNNNNKITTNNFKIQLNNIIKYNYIIANRPPTLHKMNIQSFSPIIIENKAIKLSPLTCLGYNADFDGDQMSLFAPYYKSSNIESKIKLRFLSNIMSPTTLKNLSIPTQGILVGYLNLAIIHEIYFYKNLNNYFNLNLIDILETYNIYCNSLNSEHKIFIKIKNKFELITINRSIIKFNNTIFNLY